MRTIVNATLNFGAIYVPVGVATAAKRDEIKFRTLHVDCSTPIKQDSRCPTCDVSLAEEDKVKGYEYAKGEFLVIDEQAMEELTTNRSKFIELTKFVDKEDVLPLMVERSYYLTPNQHLHRPYELLSACLLEEKLIGIGKATLWGKEFPVGVESDQGVLLLRMLYNWGEMVSAADIVTQLQWDIDPEEKALTKEFFNRRRAPLDQNDLTNDSHTKAMLFIEASLQGAKMEAPTPPPEPEPTVNMLDTLRQMVNA